MIKRSIGWFIVAIWASSLITSCSSTGNKDCKILQKAKESLVPSTYYYSKIEESQLLFEEPKVREAVSEYLYQMNNTNGILSDLLPGYWEGTTASFVKKIDNYCNSL